MVDVLHVLPHDADELHGGQLRQALLDEGVEDLLEGVGVLLLDLVEQHQGVELGGLLLRAQLLGDLVGPLPDHLLVLGEQLDAAEEGGAGHPGVVAGDQRLDVAAVGREGTVRSGPGSRGPAPGGSSGGRSS